MLLAFLLALLLVLAFPLLHIIVSKQSMESFNVKLTCFECGFESLTTTRQPFSVRFFVLVVLFLVFDVESVLLFPYLCNTILCIPYTLALSYYIFMTVLLAGLLYEWYNSMLEWTSLDKLRKLLGS